VVTFVPGFNSRFYVGSQRWSAYARGWNSNASVEQYDISTLETPAIPYLNGRLTGTASMDMMLDMVGSGQFALMNTWRGTPQPVTLCPFGITAGSLAWMLLGNQSAATVSSPVSDVVTANVTVQQDGLADWGIVLDTETAITTDTNGASTDNAALTSNGGVAHLHVTAYSGLTSNAIRIEHSVDNAAWSTLGSFASVTAVGSERLVIAVATTVNRYLRVVDDVTGSGSCTRIVTFDRR